MNDTQDIKLLIVVIQAKDVECALEALESHEVAVERLPSAGGFLGMRNATLLIKVEESRIELVSDLLKRNCRKRIEYLSVPFEGTPMPLPTTTPVTVGGANIFTFDIEHYEEV
jgi:uncharacterized protein YaaQ